MPVFTKHRSLFWDRLSQKGQNMHLENGLQCMFSKVVRPRIKPSKLKKINTITYIVSVSYEKNYQQHFLRAFLTHNKITVNLHGLYTNHILVQNKKNTSDKIIREYVCFVLYNFQQQTIDTDMVFLFFTIHTGCPKVT